MSTGRPKGHHVRVPVPDITHPTLCYKQCLPKAPPFTNAMVRCTKRKRHRGRHSWEVGERKGRRAGRPAGAAGMSKRPTRLADRIQPNYLGEMLRLRRTIQRQGLRACAAEIGISPATLMRIEHGQAFDADTLLKLCVWLLKPLPVRATAAEETTC